MNEPKTPNLGLNKIDRSSPSTTYFDLDKYLDQNWEKVDEGVATKQDLEELREAVGEIDVPEASLTQKGKVQLSSKTDGTSETVAATEKAVRDARIATNYAIDVHADSIVNSSETHGLRIKAGKMEYYNGIIWTPVAAGPTTSTENLTYYVNASTGYDGNTGLSPAQAFKTIAKAISILPEVINHRVYVRVNKGNYPEQIIISGKSGIGRIYLNASNEVTIGSCYLNNCSVEVEIYGFDVINTRGTSFQIELCKYVRLSNCKFEQATSDTGIGVFIRSASNVALIENKISNKYYALYVDLISHVYAEKNTGSNNYLALYVVGGSVVSKSDSQLQGSELTFGGGVIR
ncbi:phage tail protein [Paenibacillus sp. PK1-4R]|uniref:phage tail protein n=1 Tax=Paenibacillus sp. PK1-4R TaxID=3049075 RepID=UPI0025A1AF9B|nr:phage tail protein [Paenibacillus sp. PK1-4R]WJM09535.1 phage tail protein [Paenibacillus sp. PK1-4R]